MGFIDISPAVHIETPVWPGDERFGLAAKWSIEQGDSVTVGTVTSTTHIGAHIDAPSHVVAGAPSIEATPIEACVGTCLVLDVGEFVDRHRSPHGQVGLDAVRERASAFTTDPIDRLLLRHYPRPNLEWDVELPGVSEEVMRWFAAQGGRLMGVDLASFDPANSKTLDCHRAGIAAGVVLLEGLDLSCAPEGEAELIALPLAWQHADASPVRAVLRYL